MLRSFVAEGIGTAFLLMTIVGTGCMAGAVGASEGTALLAMSVTVGGILVALILTLGTISGAHFNPAVTLSDWIEGGVSSRQALGYVAAQSGGGILGVVLANMMFSLPAVNISAIQRGGFGPYLGEFIATFGLIVVIWGVVRSNGTNVAFAVGLFIAAAIWFTSSTAFANPAVTLARVFTSSGTGIAPSNVFGFISAEILGALAATYLMRWLTPDIASHADEVLLPRGI